MSEADAMQECLAQRIIAVVGVSENREKYGWKAYANLKSRGYEVLPVNPNYEEIDGAKCYASVRDLPPEVGLIVTVVPPRSTRRVVHEGLEAGFRRYWMQPGSEDEEAVREIEAAGGLAVMDCIMVRG